MGPTKSGLFGPRCALRAEGLAPRYRELRGEKNRWRGHVIYFFRIYHKYETTILFEELAYP